MEAKFAPKEVNITSKSLPHDVYMGDRQLNKKSQKAENSTSEKDAKSF